MTALRLVHSPLVGPATWEGVADELRARGHDVVVPSLLAAAPRGDWRACVDAAAGPGATVLVGHSGAGPLLPQIAARCDPAPECLVFVDAGVPPARGASELIPS